MKERKRAKREGRKERRRKKGEREGRVFSLLIDSNHSNHFQREEHSNSDSEREQLRRLPFPEAKL